MESWKRTRHVAWMIAMVNTPPEKRKEEWEWMPLTDEEKERVPEPPSPEQMREWFEEAKKRNNPHLWEQSPN